MATQTQTQTQTTSSPPQIKIVDRVCSIPLIASCNAALSSNVYTRSPYGAAKSLSLSAYRLTEPLQIRLAPLIVVADGYACKAVDVAEKHYPYPFTTNPEQIATDVRQRRDSASQYVKDRRDNVAQGLDRQLIPIVKVIEGAVTRMNGSESTPPSPNGEAKYQYQRVFALSKDLGDSLYLRSSEQFKELQASNVLLQRAAETAQKITNLASSSIQQAQIRIHQLSEVMLSDMKKLQSSLTADFNDLNTSLSGVIVDFKAVIKSDKPVNEKVVTVGANVKERVTPVLEHIATQLREVFAKLVQRGEEAVESAKSSASTTMQNGNNGHATTSRD